MYNIERQDCIEELYRIWRFPIFSYATLRKFGNDVSWYNKELGINSMLPLHTTPNPKDLLYL